jgi:glycosyltransferase involved in cell wall biosynthesis
VDQALISVVCPTMASRVSTYLPRAVDCYNRQTWIDKELVIVADADCDISAISALAPAALIVTSREPKTILGTKRNLGSEHSRGTFVAVWDDDDFYFPDRLAVQHDFLVGSRKSVTAFRQIPFKQGDDWYLNPVLNQEGIDSSIFFKVDWWRHNHFPDLQIGDCKFIKAAHLAGELALHTPKQFYMYAENHSDNTCDRRLPMAGWVKLSEAPTFLSS